MRPDLTLTLGLRWEYFSPITEKRRAPQQSGLRVAVHAAGRQGPDSRRTVPSRPQQFCAALRLRLQPVSAGTNWSCAAASESTTSACPTCCSPTRAAIRRSSRASGSAAAMPRTPFDNDQILYCLGSGNSIYSYPANPALAVGIDPATGAVLNRTVEVWGTQQNFPTAYAYVYSWELRIQPAGPPGRVRRIPGQHRSSPDPHRQPEFPVSEQSGVRAGLLPAAGREFELQRAQPGTDAELLRRPRTAGQLPLVQEHRPVVERRARSELQSDVSAGSAHRARPVRFRRDAFADRRRSIRTALVQEQARAGGSAAGRFPDFAHPHLSHRLSVHREDRTIGEHSGRSHARSDPSDAILRATRSTTTRTTPSSTAANWPGGGAAYFDIESQGPPGIGRNSFRGPRYFSTDLSVTKQFQTAGLHLGEAAALDVRANLYNLFNTLNLTPFGFFDPGIFADSAQFGRATQPGLAGRVVEFQGRFSF